MDFVRQVRQVRQQDCLYRRLKSAASGHRKTWPYLLQAGFTQELQQRVMQQGEELQLEYVQKIIK